MIFQFLVAAGFFAGAMCVVILFLMRKEYERELDEACEMIGSMAIEVTKLKDDFSGLREEFNRLSSVKEAGGDTKTAREIEKQERAVLEGLNNLLNYSHDIARKAARDGRD